MFRFRSVFPNRRYKEDVRSIGKNVRRGMFAVRYSRCINASETEIRRGSLVISTKQEPLLWISVHDISLKLILEHAKG